MGSTATLLIISIYFLLILIISYTTGRNTNNKSFYLGNKKSPWYVIAFGMIGASLSGVTFISVPGWVGSSQFSYMQMVLGYLLGYIVIANILLPLYYKLNLTSIYTYLDSRFGKNTYLTGASFFLLSRSIGAAFRLYLVANVLQITIFEHWDIPFGATVAVTIALIWLYTNKGGIKTIIWTDVIQTLFMFLAVGFSIYYISKDLNLNLTQLINRISESDYSKIFFFDNINDKKFFFKQFISGAFITIVMTGLDQDMMQKNLSCKNLRDAKKNMYWYGAAFLPANLLFMSLGVLLYIFAQEKGITLPEKSDDLFPLIATQGYLRPIVSVFFMLGLIAAAYSSADSALTSLTTSFTIDILGKKENKGIKERRLVHLGFSVLLIVIILIFKSINNQAVISAIFVIAGYTYGPLLGFYSLGLFTKIRIKDRYAPIISVIAPIVTYFISENSEKWLNGYKFGFELLVLNGIITFSLLLLISQNKKAVNKNR